MLPDRITLINLVIAELNLAVAKIANGDSKASVKAVLETAKTDLVETIRKIGQDIPHDGKNPLHKKQALTAVHESRQHCPTSMQAFMQCCKCCHYKGFRYWY